MVCFSSFPSLLSSPGYHQGLLSVTSELASERSPGTPRRAKRSAGGEAVAFWLGWWLRVSRAVLSPCCHSATRQSLDWEKQDVRRPIYLRAWQTKAKIARAALDLPEWLSSSGYLTCRKVMYGHPPVGGITRNIFRPILVLRSGVEWYATRARLTITPIITKI